MRRNHPHMAKRTTGRPGPIEVHTDTAYLTVAAEPFPVDEDRLGVPHPHPRASLIGDLCSGEGPGVGWACHAESQDFSGFKDRRGTNGYRQRSERINRVTITPHTLQYTQS